MYIAQGYSPELSEYFGSAFPARSMGHHFLLRKIVEDTPALLRPIVRAMSDSRFSVLKPKGKSRGDFYERHYKVDPSYRGGKIAKEFGGGRWSGDDLGWQKYGLLGRVIHGSPCTS
jgi:hypothetical protein